MNPVLILSFTNLILTLIDSTLISIHKTKIKDQSGKETINWRDKWNESNETLF